MELKQEDILLFRGLKDTKTGTDLISYLERLLVHLCDIRQLDDTSDLALKGRKDAARIIENDIIKQIRMVDEPKRAKTNAEFM
jgi:hypothetical protein